MDAIEAVLYRKPRVVHLHTVEQNMYIITQINISVDVHNTIETCNFETYIQS